MDIQTKIIAVLIILVLGFGAGWKVHSWKTQAEQLAALEERDRTIEQLKEDNESITNAYLTVADQINKNKITIVKEKVVYVPQESDARCVVNNGAVWMFNKFATSSAGSGSSSLTYPRPGTPDFAAQVNLDSGFKLSEVIEVSSTNNQTAQLCITRLKSLIDVVKKYQERTK